ncbi:MAG: glycosyltransferase family 2 protein [Bacteroidales bacterium]|nr:glycosyltransferase family 2 protein [Bacteroidales bacterium]
MKLPRITIITPSYNQVEFIEETINSLLSQDYPNLEYMIFDGGSNDGSVDIIKKYEDKLSYWVSEKDEGQTDAIQKGLSRCSGDLFAWVNSDDVLLPGCLHAVAEQYQKEQADIIHSNIIYIDSEGLITRMVRVPKQSNFFYKRGVIHMTAPAVFFKTASLLAAGGLNKNYHLSMDVDLWIRMMGAGAKVSHISKYLGAFRWHDNSKTVQDRTNRTQYENSETSTLLNSSLKNSTPRMRALWRRVYNLFQVINFNYIIAFIDKKHLVSQHYLDIFKPSED